MSRILVVDDDSATLALIVRMLTQAGHDATGVEAFEQGRQLLASVPFDLLITDIRLNGFNGLQLIITNPNPIPSIVITGFADSSLEAEVRHLGGDYLAKPFSPAALLNLVAQKLNLQGAFDVERRWTRKPVAEGLPARIETSRARIVDISYGGLRLELDSDPLAALPPAFDLALPTMDVAVRVKLVWQRRTARGNWLCGAALARTDPAAAAAWQGLVDAVA